MKAIDFYQNHPLVAQVLKDLFAVQVFLRVTQAQIKQVEQLQKVPARLALLRRNRDIPSS